MPKKPAKKPIIAGSQKKATPDERTEKLLSISKKTIKGDNLTKKEKLKQRKDKFITSMIRYFLLILTFIRFKSSTRSQSCQEDFKEEASRENT
jgi:hypothetical protein